MRVALVCPYSLSRPGGVQAQVAGLARSLRRRGVVAEVIAPADEAVDLAGVVPVGTSVGVRANNSVAPVALGLAALCRTRAALRDRDFDLVHLHEPLVPVTCLTALLTAEAPIVATFHRSGLSTAYRAVGALSRRVMNRAARRYAVSEEAADTARRALGGTYEILENAVELELFSGGELELFSGGALERFDASTSSPGREREPMPATSRPGERPVPPTVAFVGRHEARKGLGVLLSALTRLGADTRLEVAGGGPETRALRARTADDGRVVWLGELSEVDKASLLARADVLCVPSIGGESFGLVLLEGMAAGCAVVASDISGYRRVSGEGRAAVLVEPGDPGALAGALVAVLGDEGERSRLVREGREVARRHSMDALAEAYLRRYEDVVRG